MDKRNRLHQAGCNGEALVRIQDLECQLMTDLGHQLNGPQTAQTRRSLLITLDGLLCSLPLRFEMFCEEGYMSEVLDRCPFWHRAIESLHAANLNSNSELDALRNRVRFGSPFIAITNEARSFLRQWVRSIESIRRQERRMAQEAVMLDIGGEA